LDIENKMRQFGFDGCAIQGELIGEGINGNQYGIKGLDFYVFNIYGSNIRQYFDADVRTKAIEEIGLKQAPKLNITISGDIQEMLKLAEGKSLINGSEREGFVLKSQQDTSLIIKVISNKWLI
ncbi:RNA ligase family protein, partial [Arthrospira platensis SPKY1]|nr:RNA ligase family protein [Arthrospira platensis SPKY1]